jgi:hypothetical protein
MAGFLRRLVLLAVTLGAATALLVGAMATLTPTTSAKAGTLLQRDQGGAVERGVTREAGEPASKGSSPVPAVALVLGGLVLAATLPPAQRVHVYYHRPPGSYWQ